MPDPAGLQKLACQLPLLPLIPSVAGCLASQGRPPCNFHMQCPNIGSPSAGRALGAGACRGGRVPAPHPGALCRGGPPGADERPEAAPQGGRARARGQPPGGREEGHVRGCAGERGGFTESSSAYVTVLGWAESGWSLQWLVLAHPGMSGQGCACFERVCGHQT